MLAITEIDNIFDFTLIDDTIQLGKAVFTSLINAGFIATHSFRRGADFTTAANAADYLIYNSSTGALYYDAGGNTVGSAASLQIAILGTHLALTNADFMVI